MNQALTELAEHIAATMEQAVVGTQIALDELTVEVQREAVVKLLRFLRDDVNCLFDQLMDIAAVDMPERDQRFEVVYCLLSLRHNQRVRVRLFTDEATPVPSVTSLYSAAGWYEREAWDLFGILFSDNPDLRRLLTDYGFEGHPLRKDFPLSGFVEVRYDEAQKRVVYEPVRLTQDFRMFDFLSPWEGTDYVLPGDEKAERES
jgi:NADH-quinone oxidoreductase subunit C